MPTLHRTLTAALLLLLVALTLSAGIDPRLKRAKELFRLGGEEECREASRICREVNNVDAAEVMIDVLKTTGPGPGLSSGHYRDIVWEEIVNLTDPYAKARIELELKKNKQSPWVRSWCAELLGVYGDQDWAPTLIKALKDKDPEVRAAAADALGKLPLPPGGAASKKAVKALAQLAKGKDPVSRANAMIARMRLAPAGARGEMLQAVEGRAADKDGGVRCALLLALDELIPEQVEAVSARALADEDWRVRLRAVDHLGAARTKTAVDRLIDALADERPRVGLRAVGHLQEMTGQVHRESLAWSAWWKDNRTAFEFPEGGAKAQKPTAEGLTVAAYNGIRVDSDHVAFVIDKSSAMREALSSQGMTKELFARQQLQEVLGKLPEGVTFNVYTYELEVQVYGEKGAVALDPKNLKAALEFVDDQRTQGSKDIWKVLETVVSDPDVDTIYLLSSGEPDTGKYVHWNRVTAHLRDINRFQNVVVHTIAYSDNEWYRDQMEKIAEATEGEFKWFD